MVYCGAPRVPFDSEKAVLKVDRSFGFCSIVKMDIRAPETPNLGLIVQQKNFSGNRGYDLRSQ